MHRAAIINAAHQEFMFRIDEKQLLADIFEHIFGGNILICIDNADIPRHSLHFREDGLVTIHQKATLAENAGVTDVLFDVNDLLIIIDSGCSLHFTVEDSDANGIQVLRLSVAFLVESCGGEAKDVAYVGNVLHRIQPVVIGFVIDQERAVTQFFLKSGFTGH